jgi:O-antigen ligase
VQRLEAPHSAPKRVLSLAANENTNLAPVDLVGQVERVCFYGTIFAVLLSAIPYGTVDPVSRSIIGVGIAIMASLRACLAIVGRSNFHFSRLLLPMAGIVALGLVQLAPITAEARPISSDPYETKLFLINFVAILIAAETLLAATNSPHRLKVLIALVIGGSVGSALFGILREAVWDDRTSWTAAFFGAEGAGYAQFFNRNHFVFLIEMGFGLTLGLLLKGHLSERLKFPFWILSAIFIWSAIASNSRGGLISIAALSSFATALHIISRRTLPTATAQEQELTRMLLRKAALATVLVVVTLCTSVLVVAYVGGDAVAGRVEKLSGEVGPVQEQKTNRRAIWTYTTAMIAEHPIIGIGFGGYATAITEYDRSTGEFSLEQAHNDYLEFAASGGLIAIAFAALFVWQVAGRARLNFNSRDTLVRSAAFGALLGIFGVLVHSLVDFGLHTMVNALMLMVLIVIATVRLPRASLQSV